MFKLLFTPMKIGSVEIKNRFVMPAMDSHYSDAEHYFTKQALDYYAERAKGEFGLIISEYLCISEEGLASRTQAGIYDDKFIPILSSLVDKVHENGSKVFAQLHHAGRLQGSNANMFTAIGASNIPYYKNPITVHELETKEITNVIKKFTDAAIRAKKSGFDGVEIHCAHSYLLSQFLSKGVNKRVDAYGGNTFNRARIVCEIIEKIKETCGDDYPISIRIDTAEGYYGGNTLNDAIAQTKLFEYAGADVIHASHGVPIRSYYDDNGYNLENVKSVKDGLNIPVIGVGRINDPSIALASLTSNTCDFVALGRQSICDSHFPKKLKENRLNEIFTCTGCLQRCLYSNTFEEGYGTSCLINPFSGKEGNWVIEEASSKKQVLIVGAGPAGLQAGWILAKRGHQVKIVEKNNTPGGQYRLASVPAMKQDLAKTIFTYQTLCEKYNVEFQYNTMVNEDYMKDETFDELIIATGAKPIVPNISGINNDNVISANEVISFQTHITNKKVLVLGAGLVGAETAELLASYDNEVTIVDQINKIAPKSPSRVRNDLINHLKMQCVKIMLDTKVLKINKDGIDFQKDDSIETISGFDYIVVAFGSKPDKDLYEKLINSNKEIHIIGDAVAVNDAQKAIFDATKLALKI